MNFDFSDKFIKEVHTCDTLFADIDTSCDCQISMDEFKAYVAKRNPDMNDQEAVLKEFKQIDLNEDGQIQFLEFLRAICLKEGLMVPDELTPVDKLRIFEIIEFRHISANEKVELLKDLANIQG